LAAARIVPGDATTLAKQNVCTVFGSFIAAS